MSEHDEIYGRDRLERLKTHLRDLADRIHALDARGELLGSVPDLIKRLGDLRSELFHYEVRSTYDTPEIAESRRIVEDATRPPDFNPMDPEEDEPWRPPE